MWLVGATLGPTAGRTAFLWHETGVESIAFTAQLTAALAVEAVARAHELVVVIRIALGHRTGILRRRRRRASRHAFCPTAEGGVAGVTSVATTTLSLANLLTASVRQAARAHGWRRRRDGLALRLAAEGAIALVEAAAALAAALGDVLAFAVRRTARAHVRRDLALAAKRLFGSRRATVGPVGALRWAAYVRSEAAAESTALAAERTFATLLLVEAMARAGELGVVIGIMLWRLAYAVVLGGRGRGRAGRRIARLRAGEVVAHGRVTLVGAAHAVTVHLEGVVFALAVRLAARARRRRARWRRWWRRGWRTDHAVAAAAIAIVGTASATALAAAELLAGAILEATGAHFGRRRGRRHWRRAHTLTGQASPYIGQLPAAQGPVVGWSELVGRETLVEVDVGAIAAERACVGVVALLRVAAIAGANEEIARV